MPQRISIESLEEAIKQSKHLGFPIEIRPWFSLHGAGRSVANNLVELKKSVEDGLKLSPCKKVDLVQDL